MVRDNRHVFTYIFGAIWPARAIGAPLIIPYATSEAMNKHFVEISAAVAPGAHSVLVCDGAGWHPRRASDDDLLARHHVLLDQSTLLRRADR